MFKANDPITHPDFGEGSVLKVNEQEGTLLVEWVTHRVERSTPELTQSQSHVKMSSVHHSRGESAGEV